MRFITKEEAMERKRIIEQRKRQDRKLANSNIVINPVLSQKDQAELKEQMRLKRNQYLRDSRAKIKTDGEKLIATVTARLKGERVE